MPATYAHRLDGVLTSVAVKAPCRVATTAAISASGTQTIDGIVLEVGDRVLRKDESNAIHNGIWVVQTGTWTRALDWDGSRDFVHGTLVTVSEGTDNENTIWKAVCSEDDPVASISEVTFEQSQLGGVVYTSGTGISVGAATISLASIATARIMGNVSGSSAAPYALTAAEVKTALSLDNVENKSSATIRSELTSGNVTAALGFTPANAANLTNVENKSSATIRSEITSGNVTTALGYTPVDPATLSAVTGASLIGWKVNDSNGATRTVESKIREQISVSDFSGATASIQLQRAIDFAAARGGLWDVIIDGAYTVADINSAANVRLIGGKLTATNGADAIINIAASSDYFTVEGVIFDGLLLEDASATYGEAACIIQGSGVARSVGVRIIGNRFTVRNNDGALYHAVLLNDCSGEFSGNYCAQAGGDIYNFNGGFWEIHHNIALNSGDGGIAMNNGASGHVHGNYCYKCSLGIGSGPNGTTASPSTNLAFTNNVLEACDYGINAGYFAVSGREGPQFAKISGNKVINPKTWGIRFDGRASTPYMDLLVTDNQVVGSGSSAYSGATGSGHGIGIVNASGAVIMGNQVVTGLGDAFFFDGNTDMVFDDNTARSNGGYGVKWNGTNTARVGEFHETSSTSGRASGAPSTLKAGSVEFASSYTAPHNGFMGFETTSNTQVKLKYRGSDGTTRIYNMALDGPEISFREYTGTLDGSGNAIFAHGLSSPQTKTMNIRGICHDGAARYPLTFNYIDGTNISISGLANYTYIAYLELDAY